MHLDITFGLQLVESSSLVSVTFREASNYRYVSFFLFTCKWFLCYLFLYFFHGPHTLFLLVDGIFGRGGIKMASASTPTVNEPTKDYFCPLSKAKSKLKAQISGNC